MAGLLETHKEASVAGEGMRVRKGEGNTRALTGAQILEGLPGHCKDSGFYPERDVVSQESSEERKDMSDLDLRILLSSV